MKIIIMLSVLLAFFFSSCVSSLQPLADDKATTIRDNSLLGHWKDDSSKLEIWVDSVSQEIPFTYAVTVYDPSNDSESLTDTSYLKARMVELQGNRYLDISLDGESEQLMHIGGTAKFFLLPLHQFFTIKKEGQLLRLHGLNQDKMEELLKQKKFSIGYTATKELPVILTESPTQLRKKLPELLKQKDVLEEGFFFRRLNSDRQPIQP